MNEKFVEKKRIFAFFPFFFFLTIIFRISIFNGVKIKNEQFHESCCWQAPCSNNLNKYVPLPSPP